MRKIPVREILIKIWGRKFSPYSYQLKNFLKNFLKIFYPQNAREIKGFQWFPNMNAFWALENFLASMPELENV